ncbi:Hypothetical predicted protein [Mytilus galloprovincialis]|uniref:Ig-like domain-containing protein n=1 Tax=Mytilus galloprovincialis TaxID=29158 RepID=A0A8B6H9V7_MYTGA|nr:Hypothetical predicted protein [Mytilus galloprovincialis]
MENTEYNLIYFSTNEAITLKCNCRVSFWSGPVVTNFGSETSPVTITDIYGNPNVWNVTIYMHGGKVANTLPEKLIKRLNVIGDYFDLHITNLSNSDQGLYICDLKEFCLIKEKRYLLQQKLLPEKIEIENVTHDNTVIGIENYALNLVCFVESGKPPAVLTWRRNGTIIKQGGSRKLRYSFIPKKTDHQSVYICEVQNQDMEKPLTKQIHLSIKCKIIICMLHVSKRPYSK